MSKVVIRSQGLVTVYQALIACGGAAKGSPRFRPGGLDRGVPGLIGCSQLTSV